MIGKNRVGRRPALTRSSVHPVRTPRQVCVWCYLIAQWHGGHEVTVVLKPLTCIGVARGGRTYAARMVLSLNASIIIGR